MQTIDINDVKLTFFFFFFKSGCKYSVNNTDATFSFSFNQDVKIRFESVVNNLDIDMPSLNLDANIWSQRHGCNIFLFIWMQTCVAWDKNSIRVLKQQNHFFFLDELLL